MVKQTSPAPLAGKLLREEGDISVRKKDPAALLSKGIRFDAKWSGKYKRIKAFLKQRLLPHAKNLFSDQGEVFRGKRLSGKQRLRTRTLFVSFRWEARKKSAAT
jgi:hypothetical protein